MKNVSDSFAFFARIARRLFLFFLFFFFFSKEIGKSDEKPEPNLASRQPHAVITVRLASLNTESRYKFDEKNMSDFENELERFHLSVGKNYY